MTSSIASTSLSSALSSFGSNKDVSSDSHSVRTLVQKQISEITAQYPKTTISISPAFIKKMETDPLVAAKGKELLDGLPAAEEWFHNKLKQNGMELVSGGVVIDADGNMSSWSYVKTTTGTDHDKRADYKEINGGKRVADKKKKTALASYQSLWMNGLSDGNNSNGKAESVLFHTSRNKIDIEA